MKTNTKLFLGVFTALAVIAFIIVWDLVIRENIESEEVLIIKPGVTVHPYDIIRSDDVMVEKRNRATFIEGYFKPEHLKDVVGKQARQLLVGNQILSKRHIDIEAFEADPTKGEAIRPIPNQWIYAIPNTVRRKDRIDIYLMKDHKEIEMNENDEQIRNTQITKPRFVGLSPEQELALEIEDSKNASILGDDQQILNYQDEREKKLKESGLTEESWQRLVRESDIPLLVNVPVAYAKDGSGNEILTGGSEEVASSKNNKDQDRLTSTGAIVNLELILSEDDHRLLLSFVQNGYRLYITYN